MITSQRSLLCLRHIVIIIHEHILLVVCQQTECAFWSSLSHRCLLSLFWSIVTQENLTEALADLDAALEKELSCVEEEEPAMQVEGSHSKVEELEKQCKTLESELDSVKCKDIGFLSL